MCREPRRGLISFILLSLLSSLIFIFAYSYLQRRKIKKLKIEKQTLLEELALKTNELTLKNDIVITQYETIEELNWKIYQISSS